MRLLAFLVFVLSFLLSDAQKNLVSPSTAISIGGDILNPTQFSIDDLKQMPSESIPDAFIYNHDGIPKDTLKNLKGIPLKTILDNIEFKYESPKELGSFIFIMVASDGYAVSCSWNEIYNTEIGRHMFVITEMNGRKLGAIPEQIVFLSTMDLKVNRRYVRGLENIIVRKAHE